MRGLLAPSLTGFGNTVHGPYVILIAQCPENSLPQCLVPAGLSGPGLEQLRLAAQPHFGSLPQQITQLVFAQLPQGCTAFATQRLRPGRSRFSAQPQTQLAHRSVQSSMQRNGW